VDVFGRWAITGSSAGAEAVSCDGCAMMVESIDAVVPNEALVRGLRVGVSIRGVNGE
jgi:hypothetical protein